MKRILNQLRPLSVRFVLIVAASLVWTTLPAQDNLDALRQAAEQGAADAQVELGRRYLRRHGVPRDEIEAARWFHLAAEQGNADARLELGHTYTRGYGIPHDRAEGLRWYRLAAGQGNADALFELARRYHDNGNPQDNAEAARWFRMALEARSDSRLPAQQDFGAIRQAAEQGDAEAQTALGDMFNPSDYSYTDDDVPKDQAEALRWYRLAAEQGHSTAQWKLGFSYTRGTGVPQDDAEAVRWLRLSAEQHGDRFAAYFLGVAYSQGHGVVRDDVEAVRWYRDAAESNYESAQFDLARAYYEGIGVPEDHVQAVMWLILGRAALRENQRELYASAVSGLTRDQIARASELARVCMLYDTVPCGLMPADVDPSL